jgi:hypothetical protein
MGHVLKRTGVIAVALVVLVVLAWVSYSRAAFGVWNPMAQPNRIEYCDRRYYPGSHFNRALIDSAGNSLGVFPFAR